MRRLTCDPGTEVTGGTVLSLLENMQADEVTPYLRKYGLMDIRADHWYPLQNMQNVLNDLQRDNLTPSFVAIGMTIAEVALMPPHLQNATLSQVLEAWDDHYQVNHRNGEIGHKIAEKVTDRHYALVLDGGVYPDDFEYGVVYGFAKRFLQPGTHFTVWYEEGVQRLDQGGSHTIIHISWE